MDYYYYPDEDKDGGNLVVGLLIIIGIVGLGSFIGMLLDQFDTIVTVLITMAIIYLICSRLYCFGLKKYRKAQQEYEDRTPDGKKGN